MRFFSLFCALSLLSIWNSYASPAYPGRVPVVLPSGDTVYVRLRGDEFLKWAETEDGYTLLRDSLGEWTYAVPSPATGKAMASEWKLRGKVGKSAAAFSDFLRTVPRRLEVDAAEARVRRSRAAARMPQQAAAAPAVGERRVLVILMSFPDQPFRKEKADFEALFNAEDYAEDGAMGSVRDYYSAVSYGQLQLQSDLFGPYEARYPMSYYGGNTISGGDSNPAALFAEAMQAVAAETDLSLYDGDGDGYVDNVHLIFAGYGEEAGAPADAIWSHEATFYEDYVVQGMKLRSYSCAPELRGSSGSGISRIGPHCHEIGHALGAMDYYDTDYSGSGGDFPGTGEWDIMASGNWNREGILPADFNPYVKAYNFGWVEPQALLEGGDIQIAPSARSADAYYRIDTPVEGEFYLLENRSREGFGAGLPGSGLLVYHIHPDLESAAATNSINASHPQMCYPVCAASSYRVPSSVPASYGEVNSAGCPFPGSYGRTAFSSSTVPAAFCWDSGGEPGFELSDIALLGDGTISLSCRYGEELPGEDAEGEALYAEGFEQQGDWDIESGQKTGWQLYGAAAGGGITIADELDVQAAGGENYLALKSRSFLLVRELKSTWRLPLLPVDAACPHVLRFAYQNRPYRTIGGGRLEVLCREGEGDAWDTLAVFSDQSSSWIEKEVRLPASAGGSLQIAFVGNIATGGLYLDDVRVFSQPVSGVSPFPEASFSLRVEPGALLFTAGERELLELYDLRGIRVRTLEAVPGENRWDIRPGLYLLRRGSGGRVLVIP